MLLLLQLNLDWRAKLPRTSKPSFIVLLDTTI